MDIKKSLIENNKKIPDHIKEKIMLFFLETSVPRIIKERREAEKDK